MAKSIFLRGILTLGLILNLSILLGQDSEVKLTPKEMEIFESKEESLEQESNNESEYDIIIIDIGFNRWLNQIAQPKGYYTQSYMENRNYLYVLEWNRRVLDPAVFDPQLYELQIDYDPNIDYGYDVNYQLYNYFIYFQRRYKQRLGPFLPRI
ncbi:MAG: hypothetical protein HKP38_01370 [Croceitalea sp.]|nr:hypothetical protein [Croceitalea sp.]NNL07853.1 hypothetical protein [Croceitalea sp.]